MSKLSPKYLSSWYMDISTYHNGVCPLAKAKMLQDTLLHVWWPLEIPLQAALMIRDWNAFTLTLCQVKIIELINL